MADERSEGRLVDCAGGSEWRHEGREGSPELAAWWHLGCSLGGETAAVGDLRAFEVGGGLFGRMWVHGLEAPDDRTPAAARSNDPESVPFAPDVLAMIESTTASKLWKPGVRGSASSHSAAVIAPAA